ncbi:hypothetical protein ISREJYDI_CDS0186 [Pseudomonas phage UNO-G1W1]|uniref:Uncharacterized protein n=1 Tax=Pseudomonas phage UNO-G1W1 TaxID=3136609 RepID=A0AAX4QNF2_9CAUD
MRANYFKITDGQLSGHRHRLSTSRKNPTAKVNTLGHYISPDKTKPPIKEAVFYGAGLGIGLNNAVSK